MSLANSIVGVWKYVSFFDRYVETGAIVKPFGESPSGYIVYTKGGHILFTLVGDRDVPNSPNPSAPEKIALFSSSSSCGGRYQVEDDDSVTVTWDASWNQWWTGRSQKRQIEIEGNKMTLTSAPTKSVATGDEIVFIATLERVE
ncbi:lipocalin-like domain-containing protein [Bradyrhizobium sp. USDA 4502]